MSWPTLRDVLLFTAGMVGIAHETLLRSVDRPTLLLLFGAMVGLPAFLRSDDRRNDDDDDDDDEKP